MSMFMMQSLVIWGLIATVAMTSILQASQSLGLSRMSMPFLLGSAISGHRDRATAIGFFLYLIGGWAFAFIYYDVLSSIGLRTWWMGALVGIVHGAFLLVCLMPVLPAVHPRMASEHAGPTAVRRLEPPGFLGVNYGFQTPLVTLIAQAAYGGVLGGCLQLQRAMIG